MKINDFGLAFGKVDHSNIQWIKKTNHLYYNMNSIWGQFSTTQPLLKTIVIIILIFILFIKKHH